MLILIFLIANDFNVVIMANHYSRACDMQYAILWITQIWWEKKGTNEWMNEIVFFYHKMNTFSLTSNEVTSLFRFQFLFAHMTHSLLVTCMHCIRNNLDEIVLSLARVPSIPFHSFSFLFEWNVRCQTSKTHIVTR